MKIAMLTNNYKPFVGGVPISVERLANSLRVAGHSVTVFAPGVPAADRAAEAADTADSAVVRCSCSVRGSLVFANFLDPVLERHFREGKFDVIHVHHPMLLGWTGVYLSWKYRVPLIFTYHTRYEQYLHYLHIPFGRALLPCLKAALPAYTRVFSSLCDCVIAPTPGMADYLKKIGVRSRVEVLPTGLLPESYEPDREHSVQLREQLLEGHSRLFVTVARLAKEKNLDFLLRCMALYKKQGGPSFRLALVGTGPEEPRLQELARHLGLAEEICFVGKVDNEEVKHYCAAADGFLFSSTSETQGIVLLEAMAAGTPVLAVRASGTCDIVENGKNGYMTEEKEEAFVERMLSLWPGEGEAAGIKADLRASDAVLYHPALEELGEGARRTAERYRAERIGSRALSCYGTAAVGYRKSAVLHLVPAERIG